MGPSLLEEVYNLEDALVCAQYLNSFIRHADVVRIACLAQIVNVIAPILTRPDGILVQSIYHPLRMFSRHAKGVSLAPVVDGPTYSAGARGEVAVLDVSASHDEETGAVSLFLVNRGISQDLEVEVSFGDRRSGTAVEVEVLSGDDPKAHNSWERPDAVTPVRGRAARGDDGKLQVRAPALGFTVVRARLERPGVS